MYFSKPWYKRSYMSCSPGKHASLFVSLQFAKKHCVAVLAQSNCVGMQVKKKPIHWMKIPKKNSVQAQHTHIINLQLTICLKCKNTLWFLPWILLWLAWQHQFFMPLSILSQLNIRSMHKLNCPSRRCRKAPHLPDRSTLSTSVGEIIPSDTIMGGTIRGRNWKDTSLVGVFPASPGAQSESSHALGPAALTDAIEWQSRFSAFYKNHLTA